MSAFAMSPNSALRIVSLPVEFETTYDVSSFVSTELGFGEATWVNIVNMVTDRGVKFRTAFVDISRTPANAPRANDLLNDFIFYSNGRFHFDNGKPMDHLKIVACKRNKPSTDALALAHGEWSSIYIPVVASDLSLDNGDLQFKDQGSLAEFFEDFLKIGQVSRIDFVDKQAAGRAAFVHFDHWYNNRTATLVRKTIETQGQFSCKGFYNGFEFSAFDNTRFLVLKMDTRGEPVAVDTSARLEAASIKIAELQAEVARLKSYSIVPVPIDGLNVQLDVGNILAENHRLKAKLEKLETGK